MALYTVSLQLNLCKTVTLKKTKNGFQDRLSLNTGQKYCRMLQRKHSAILSTFMKLPVVIPGRVAQSVLLQIQGTSSIPVRSHTFVEIDYEIISTVILLPSAESFKKDCCQLQAKVCARRTG